MKKYIFMAVAGMLALSSCSNDDNEQTPQNAPRQMTFTAGFGDGTQTRTTLNADKSVSFDANDAISIFSANNDNVQFTTTAGGATADFTGTAVAGDATYYAVYPYKDSYTFSGGIVSGVTIEDYQPVNTIAGQTWSKNSVISYATTTGSDLEFHNPCALLKITNNTGWGAEIKISAAAGQSLAGTFDLDTSTGALTATAGSNEVQTYIAPDNTTVYLAIAPGTYTNFTAAKSNMDDTGTWYSKTKASVTFAAGKIYDLGTTSSWMAAPAATGHALSASVVGDVVGSDGQAYDVTDKDNLPTGVTAAGMVAYKSGSNGLVIALSDEASTTHWYSANSGAAGHTPAVTGQTWKLPSVAEWKQMFTDLSDEYGEYYDCNALNTALGNAGGTALLLGQNIYWSSTVVDDDNVSYVILYDSGYAYFTSGDNTSSGVHTRVCISF